MRKKLLILLGILVFLVIAVPVAVAVILQTDLPRKLTEHSLEQKLGSPVSIRTQHTTWGGHTQMTGVRFDLPVMQPAYLEFDTVQVTHQHLLKFLTGQGLGIASVKADGAALHPNRTGEGFEAAIGNAAITLTVNSDADDEDTSVLTISLEDADRGCVQTVITVSEDQVQVNSLDGKLLGGAISGDAVLDKQDWTKTRIHASWEDINLHDLGTWGPGARTYAGIVSGRIDIDPAQEKRPLEPLAVTGQVDFEDGLVNNLTLQTMQFSGAVGQTRLLLTHVEVPLLDGLLRARLRASKNKDVYALYANCDFANIDVNLAANAFSETPSEMVGRLDGKAFVMSSGKLADMNGTVDVQLSESNLVHHPVIATLYNALNLRSNSAEPQGEGSAKLRFDGANLRIDEFYYYNRGVEILGTGQIVDLRLRKNSPVEGVVLATTRPLKEIGLPGVDVLDKFFSAAQKDMAVVKVDGTLAEIDVNVTALPQIQAFLNTFLGGKE
jgi:hypothetical protein